MSGAVLPFPDRRRTDADRRRQDARNAIQYALVDLASIADVVQGIEGYVLFASAEARAVIRSIEIQCHTAQRMLADERERLDSADS